MKITNESGRALGSLSAQVGGDPSLGEGEVPIDCCNPGGDPPPDRAEDADVLTVNAPATGGIVQQKVGAYVTPASVTTLNFDATPTNGNTMVAFVFGTDGNNAEVTTSGWAKLQEGTANLEHVEIWTKVAGAAEPVGVSLGVVSGSNTTHRLVLFEIAGSTDDSDKETAQPNSSPLTGPAVTASGTGVLLSAFIGQVATYMGDPTWVPQGGLITDSFLRQSPGRLVSWVGHMSVVAGAYNPSLTTTTLYSGTTTANAAIIVGATPTAAVWNVPAPNTVDGDDATYQEIDGEDVLQIDLGGAFRIVRSRLLVGADDAGSRSYQIGGANEADFSDLVTLASITFDATGAFTPDDLDIVWTTDQSYRYFQLTGSDENRRVFSWELYEPDTSQGQDHNHDVIEDAIDEVAAGLDEHVTEILTHLTAETDDTLVLAPDGLGGVEFRAPAAGSGDIFYAPFTWPSTHTTFTASGTSTAVTTTAYAAATPLIAIVYSTGRGCNSITQTNVTWTQRYTGNGNSQYIEVWTGVIAGGAAGTTATFAFTGANRQQCEVISPSSGAFTTATAAVTATAAGTALATVAAASMTVGGYYMALCSAAGPASSYSGINHPGNQVSAFGGTGRGFALRMTQTNLSYWSLSSSAVSYFIAIIRLT